MNMHNARHKEQLDRMRTLYKKNICFFCDNNVDKLGAAPAIYRKGGWYIKKNDYPYKGSVHHYLIVSEKHVTSVSQIPAASWSGLHSAVRWLEKKLGVKGYSLFVRSGSIHYTGATIDHIHFHLVSGVKKIGKSNLSEYILAPLGHKKK